MRHLKLSVIQLGDTGDLVKAWQRIVSAKADGNFGPNTHKLVCQWQADRNIEPDGVVGPLTAGALALGDLIKPYEGLRLVTYDDHDSKPLKLVNREWRRPDGAICIGYPTIGWGRRLLPGEYIENCTRYQADIWFDSRLAQVETPAINRYIPKDLVGERCAAASYSYNCGTGALAKLAHEGFSEDYWTTHYVTSKGVPHAGLAQRRREEYALFSA